MPRILGVDIPANKKLEYALRYIYGIGPSRAKAIVAISGLDADRRSGDLSEEELNQLASIVVKNIEWREVAKCLPVVKDNEVISHILITHIHEHQAQRGLPCPSGARK